MVFIQCPFLIIFAALFQIPSESTSKPESDELTDGCACTDQI